MVNKIHEQGYCPVCGKFNLDYETFQNDGENICYPWTCSYCHATGKEYYSVNFIGHEDIQPAKKVV